MRARAAWAAISLISVVSGFSWAQTPFIEPNIVFDLKTKVCCSNLVEGVPVNDVSKYRYAEFGFRVPPKLVKAKFALTEKGHWNAGTGRNYNSLIGYYFVGITGGGLIGHEANGRPMGQIVSGRLSGISQGNVNLDPAVLIPPGNAVKDEYIRPQLPFGGFLSASYEFASRQPQRNGGEEQQGRERSYKRIGDFKPVSIERRPELGSLIFAVLCLGLAFPAAAFASDRWGSGRRLIGGFGFGVVAWMGLQSTIGLLLGIDLWSLWRLLG